MLRRYWPKRKRSCSSRCLARLDERRKKGEAELTADEISSLFTFVYAKAAEAVTNLVNSQPNNFDLLGMLDGKVPIYADDRLTRIFQENQSRGGLRPGLSGLARCERRATRRCGAMIRCCRFLRR